MSAFSIDPASIATAIPDVDWECPQDPPPPPPPEAPPLPIIEQTPVKACFFDSEKNMHARPPISPTENHEEASRLEAVNKGPSPPSEPKFVMFRTMNIVFLDPSGVVAAR